METVGPWVRPPRGSVYTRGITKTTPPPLWKRALQPVFLPLYRRATLRSAEALYRSHPVPSGPTAISRYRSYRAFSDLPLSILHHLGDASLLTNSRAPCKALNPHLLAQLCFGEGPQCLPWSPSADRPSVTWASRACSSVLMYKLPPLTLSGLTTGNK